jgi:hypothetical protein
MFGIGGADLSGLRKPAKIIRMLARKVVDVQKLPFSRCEVLCRCVLTTTTGRNPARRISVLEKHKPSEEMKTCLRTRAS